MTLMPIEWSEVAAPGLVVIGLFCLVLPWVSRENAWVRVTLVGLAMILTWRYLL